MMNDSIRIDKAHRLIPASPEEVYQAFVDSTAWQKWLPPAGMTCSIAHFDAREGGTYELTLSYDEGGYGKTSDSTDVSRGRFVELVPGKRMVQEVEFESDDPAYSGTMRMSWVITPEGDGSRVTILAEDVPSGISHEDHAIGMQSTLENLERYLESIPAEN